MENYPVINKKMVKKNRYLRRIRKESKKNYPNRGSKAVTRNYFGKFIRRKYYCNQRNFVEVNYGKFGFKKGKTVFI